jgi:hypothetical protein
MGLQPREKPFSEHEGRLGRERSAASPNALSAFVSVYGGKGTHENRLNKSGAI